MPSKLIKTPIMPDKYYHVFNKANNGEKIFRENSDYQFFLLKLGELVTQRSDIFAFCLLPNHFHLLIKPKPLTEGETTLIIVESLRKFFQIYVQYFNDKYKRRGSLFLKSFRRLEIEEDFHLKFLVFYIHYNPQKHGVIKDYKTYPYSSYQLFFKEKQSHLRKFEVLEWFYNSIEDFEIYHQDCLDRKNLILFQTGTPSRGMESLSP
jgi:REP element-mobilizing transposase RayT